MKGVFKHQDLQIFDLKLNKYQLNVSHFHPLYIQLAYYICLATQGPKEQNKMWVISNHVNFSQYYITIILYILRYPKRISSLSIFPGISGLSSKTMSHHNAKQKVCDRSCSHMSYKANTMYFPNVQLMLAHSLRPCDAEPTINQHWDVWCLLVPRL